MPVECLPVVFSIDHHTIDIGLMRKRELELLFRKCRLRGDTARIGKDELVRRIASCDKLDVVDALAEMLDDEEFNPVECASRAAHGIIRDSQSSTTTVIVINGKPFRLSVTIEPV